MRQAAARQRQRRQRRLIKGPLSHTHAALPGPLSPLCSPAGRGIQFLGLMTSPAGSGRGKGVFCRFVFGLAL